MTDDDSIWQRKEVSKQQAFSSRISTTAQDFADTYNLMIKEYPHQAPKWTFIFRHPNGEIGEICVQESGHGCVTVHSMSWIDDYDADIRYLKLSKGEQCALQNEALKDLLVVTLRSMLSWEKKDLTPSVGDYEEWKREEWTKEEFDSIFDEYPVAKLD